MFSAIDDWIKAIEDILEYSYPFGRVRLTMMPPNYPFGGFGHPHLTYISSSAVVGSGYSL